LGTFPESRLLVDFFLVKLLLLDRGCVFLSRTLELQGQLSCLDGLWRLVYT